MRAGLFLILMASLIGVCPLFAQESENDSLPDNYLPFTLERVDSSWVGSSEFLEGFTVSVDLPGELAESAVTENDLLSLIADQRVTGVFDYPNGKSTPIEYEIVDHRGRNEIYMKTAQGYFVWESFSISNDTLHFVIDWWYRPPATDLDVEVLEMAEVLLADSSNWRQDDDRKCQDDSETNRWSLFCALKHASVSVTGEYNHHNTAMQTARSVIDDMIPEHDFAHILMDFNNASTTSHGDMLAVLRQAKARILAELKQAAD